MMPPIQTRPGMATCFPALPRCAEIPRPAPYIHWSSRDLQEKLSSRVEWVRLYPAIAVSHWNRWKAPLRSFCCYNPVARHTRRLCIGCTPSQGVYLPISRLPQFHAKTGKLSDNPIPLQTCVSKRQVWHSSVHHHTHPRDNALP